MVAPIAVVLSGGGIIDLDGTALIQLVLFFFALVVLRKLLFRPMVTMFEAREAAIDGAKQEAKDMNKDATEKQSVFEERMSKVRLEAQESREKLRQEGLALERKVLQNVRDEITRKAEEANADLARQKNRLEGEMETSVPGLARDIAERVLGRTVH